MNVPEACKSLGFALGQLVGPVGALKDLSSEHVWVPSLVYCAQQVHRDINHQQLPLLFKGLQVLVQGFPACKCHCMRAWSRHGGVLFAAMITNMA
jgi:hypothetical protein